METKFVIVLHNHDEHVFEESDLFDSYPPASTIEYYLRQSNYHFAKVEKRYSLSFEEAKEKLTEDKPFAFVQSFDDEGIPHIDYAKNEQELSKILNDLEQQDIRYRYTLM